MWLLLLFLTMVVVVLTYFESLTIKLLSLTIKLVVLSTLVGVILAITTGTVCRPTSKKWCEFLQGFYVDKG